MSMVVNVLSVWGPRERKKFYILCSDQNKIPSVQFVVELHNFAKVLTNMWWWLYLSILHW